MGLLTRLGEPILERLRALTTQSRMVAVSLGLLIVIGLWLLAGRTASHEFVALLDGREFTEPQMARLIAAFRKHRLEGARISGRNVEIPAAHKDFYLMAVDAENAWPAKFDAPVERALAGANPLMSLAAEPREPAAQREADAGADCRGDERDRERCGAV
jgi:hypothetical protein